MEIEKRAPRDSYRGPPTSGRFGARLARGNGPLVAVLAACAVLPCACIDFDECKNAGDYWCQGNVLHFCDPAGNPHPFHNVESSINCDRYDAFCKEIEGERGIAGCVISNTPCPDDRSSVCVNKRVGSCVPTGYPEVSTSVEYSCEGKGLYCLESERYGDAHCSYLPESCSPEGATRCSADDPAIYYKCRHEAWQFEIECKNRSLCVQATDSAIICAGSGTPGDAGSERDGGIQPDGG